MAALIYLDTHVVAWLYAGSVDHFTETARERLQFGLLRISPMVQFELQFLYETKRTTRSGEAVVNDLVKRMGLAGGIVKERLVDAGSLRTPLTGRKIWGPSV